jgi:hypothetical protein
VLRDPIANAAQSINATIVGPVDRRNVRVHEEGTANVRTVLPDNAFSVVRRQLGGTGLILIDGCDASLPAGTRWLVTSFAVAIPQSNAVAIASPRTAMPNL